MSSNAENHNDEGQAWINDDRAESTPATENVASDDDDWVNPSPRPRRKDTKDDKKKKKKGKKKKKKKKSEKKTSYFGADGEQRVVEEGTGDDQQDDRVRAPSVEYLPPPPSDFTLNPAFHYDESAKKRDEKPLRIHDEHAQPSRPGVMQVRTMDDELDRTENENFPSGGGDGYRSHSSSSGDVMAQAEIVEAPAVITAAVTPDFTDELQVRVNMLEEAKREEKEKNNLCKKRLLLALFFLALMGGTIGVTVFLVGKKGDPPTEAPSLSPSSQPSSLPTQSPSMFPSSFPTVDVEELWISVIQSKSPATTFFDVESPEYQALDWMVQDPLTRSLFNETHRVIQRFALAVLWYATGSAIGGGWLDDQTECLWDLSGRALRCDGRTEAVVSLDLAGFSLEGKIPKEMGLLSALTYLGLDGNSFEDSTIPTELGKLRNLTQLDLSHAELVGTIPTEIFLLTDLTSFFFGANYLEGTLQTEIGMLSSAELFVIYACNMTGTIPSEIGLMTSLTILDVSENSLSGTVPSELAELTNLEILHMYDTDPLSGEIPSSLCSPSRELSINCDGPIECTCCSGTWPDFADCPTT